MPERAEVAQGIRVVEVQQVLSFHRAGFPRHFVELLEHRTKTRGRQARTGQQDRKRVHVVADRLTAHESGLHWGSAAPHERVMDRFSRRGQPCDEELGQLRLEASTIANLLNRVTLTLLGGPELVNEVWNTGVRQLLCGCAEIRKLPDGSKEIFRGWRRSETSDGRRCRGVSVEQRQAG